MMRTVILFFLLMTLIACGEKNEKDIDTINIQGHIDKPLADRIYFYTYRDSVDFFIAKMTALDSAVIDENGNYSLTIKSKGPHVFNLQHGNKDLVTSMFVFAGNHIRIKFTGTEHVPEIEPAGKDSKFNIYLLKFQQQFYRDPEASKMYYVSSNYMDVEQFKTYIDTREKSMLSFYYDFFKSDTLIKPYHDFAIYSIHYEIACDRLMYLWKNRMKGEPVKAGENYFDFLTPGFIENREAFITPSYIRFLNLYLKDVFERKVESGELHATDSTTLVPAVGKYKLAYQLYSGIFRDAVLYNLLINDMQDVKHDSHNEMVSPHLDSLQLIFKTKYSLN